ncbi:MAG: DUF4011 domain-containing anti-phage protein Hhe [Pseudohongiellaceae bacterium]
MTTSPNSDSNASAQKALESLRLRLLDLTARNRLINFKHTKAASLRVIDELPDQLVETLLGDGEMRFQSVPDPTESDLLAAGYLDTDAETGETRRLHPDPTAEAWAKHLGLSTGYEVPEPDDKQWLAQHSDNKIQTLLFPNEMESRLKTISGTADSAIQEMGANILYLALGFLEWYEASSSDQVRLAPLFLVPVTIERGRLDKSTATYQFSLRYSGEEIIPNLSLREKLRADFAMALPDLQDNVAPEDYIREVANLIEEQQPRWRVRRYISLALLNFSKLLMYLDLDRSRWPAESPLIEHPTVSRFLSGYRPAGEEEIPIDPGFGEEHVIDEITTVHDDYPLIHNADSSQHSALIDALDGSDLVIEGPPGTGKSQTIANLIAAAMVRGKKVLFVAEKLAALEVVKNRLDEAGLGDFCLELHSHKSQKRKVLEDVSTRINKQSLYESSSEVDTEIRRYERLRKELTGYAKDINQQWKNTGKTLHELFSSATRYRKIISIKPDAVRPEGYDGDHYSPDVHSKNLDKVSSFSDVYRSLTEQLGDPDALRKHLWRGVGNGDLQILDVDSVVQSLADWQKALHQVNEQRISIAHLLDCAPEEVSPTVGELERLVTDLNLLPALQGNELLDTLPLLRGDVLSKTKRYLSLFEKIQESYAALEKRVAPEILQDLSLIDRIVLSSEILRNRVGKTVTLGLLAEAISRLSAMRDQLEQLEEPLRGMAEALGETGEQHLSMSERGLKEMQSVVRAVAQLKPAYWRYRDNLFDNEELDDLLPALNTDVEQLKKQRALLENTFRLDRIPPESEVARLRDTLIDGGLLKWLRSDWRAARAQVRLYAVNSRVKFKELLDNLDDLAGYARSISKLNSSSVYQESLGDYINGVDTEIETLIALRDWYRQIRQQYGVGFGPKVALGHAILELPEDTARAVRSLADRGLLSQLDDIFDDLQSIRGVFSPVTVLQRNDALLAGPTGIVADLLKDVTTAINDCMSIGADQGSAIEEMVNQVEELATLKSNVQAWADADYDNRLFGGRLGLKAGPETDNFAALGRLRATLKVAEILDKRIHNKSIQSYCYQNPGSSAIKALLSQSHSLGEATALHSNALNAYSELVRLDYESWTSQSGESIEAVLEHNDHAIAARDQLAAWLDYVRSRDSLEQLGLQKLVRCIDNQTLPITELEDAYKAAIFDLLAREVLQERPHLARFFGPSHDVVRTQFAECDEKLSQLQRSRAAYTISRQTVPEGTQGARASELTEKALLDRECAKQKRHIPIRQLVDRAGNALLSLKPCFMMGPMSVAQYLAPGQLSFDLVIMDEASQIKPQDALGAIARGSQLVVVGDPKQLPPTSFFDRIMEDEDEDPTSLQESESILDAALPMFPARRLRWHYRSQHENLIAFSNREFYDENLVLFPSPNSETTSYGIKYHRVARGCFVNRRNMEESREIALAVKEHFLHHSDESLGIVAMSSEQRLQIESAVESLGKDDPAFQTLLEQDMDRREPLFIKNLENVQGDERDVIMISMTYGPSEPGGKVYQRFGPINADVGWRRLNVLFTRSRRRMHIFSSMRADDILVQPGSKRGVKALKDFLAYCETGILHRSSVSTRKPPDSDFEIAVMEMLGEHGFEAVPQVGVAGFFIDLAVRDPGKPGRFLMGIECDGATYHSAKSARDRDHLRQKILERLGWRIRRIWSTDWFKQPDVVLKPLIKELNELKTIPTSEPDEETEECLNEEAVEQEFDSENESSRLRESAAPNASLRERLTSFDQNVIRQQAPDTDERRRLLRPAMLEALIEYTPINKMEFLEIIPSYIRNSTDPAEGRYLEEIFRIINASLEEEELL